METVRILNDWTGRGVSVAPLKWSVARPICGSFEKPIAIVLFGFTNSWLSSVIFGSPRTVTDIDELALGASIMIFNQVSPLLVVVVRVDAETTEPWLFATVVTSFAAIWVR